MHGHSRRSLSTQVESSTPAPAAPRSDWATLRRLFPYLWQYKWRVMFALAFMIAAKMANVGVPLLLKQLVDSMNPKGGVGISALLVVPAALLFAYGLLRLSTTLFTELRELVFAKATEGASRAISLQVFRHLHALSLRFHLVSDQYVNYDGFYFDDLTVLGKRDSGYVAASVNKITTDKNWLIFPNPATEKVSVRPAELNGEEMVIYNSVGQKVGLQRIENGQLDMKMLQPGLYFIALNKAGFSGTPQKLVITR